MSQADNMNTPLPNQKSHRKASKPLMERRRRARINACLGELRALLQQAHATQGCRRSKLEKADILELTVRHLKALSHRTADSAMLRSRFCAGYADCAREVSRFLGNHGGFHGPTGADPPRPHPAGTGFLLRALAARVSAVAAGIPATPQQRHPVTLRRIPRGCWRSPAVRLDGAGAAVAGGDASASLPDATTAVGEPKPSGIAASEPSLLRRTPPPPPPPPPPTTLLQDTAVTTVTTTPTPHLSAAEAAVSRRRRRRKGRRERHGDSRAPRASSEVWWRPW